LDVLNKSIDETVKHALVEDRILVGEDTPKGDRFLAPELASTISPKKRKPQYYFVLARDLPSKWFSSAETLANRKAKAKRWPVNCGCNRAVTEKAHVKSCLDLYYFGGAGRSYKGERVPGLAVASYQEYSLPDNSASNCARSHNFCQ